MKIVQTDEIPLKRGLEHRGGIFHGRIMVEGEPGALDNFQLSFGQMGGDFNSPRHRHNFEQIRYQLEGVLDYGRDGKLTAGMVGYFPEAVYYGPQSQDPNIPCKTIVLQFGGASGSGYLSQAEVQAGMQALKREGEFKDGVFRRRADVEGKRNVDGYQAIWEHAQRSAHGLSQAALPAADLHGSRDLRLGAGRGRSRRVREAARRVHGTAQRSRLLQARRRRELHRARQGRLCRHPRRRARSAAQPLRALTTVYVDAGETVTFTAQEETELLHFGLPNLAGLRMPAHEQVHVEAAE